MYYSRILDNTDEQALQQMLLQCNDYFELIFKRNCKETEANETFVSIPENKSYEDKFVIGIFNLENELKGVIDLIRDYPEKNTWFLGLMLFSPDFRNNGIGKRVFDDTEEYAVDLGAKIIRLAVVEQNKKGLNFWEKVGFKIIKEKTQELEGIATKIFILEKKVSDI
ncbi:MAG: GNAT family N-acetyltransferase [Candidatus Sericytochromatia bacterium]